MISLVKQYTHWLHGKWPAGGVEKLPLSNADGTTSLPGTYIVGDLTGVPLLKFSADSGAKAVQDIQQDKSFIQRKNPPGVLDLIIIGGGVSGYAAALEAQKNSLNFLLIESANAFSTIENFPKAKPIYTYPSSMTPAGELSFTQDNSVKEDLLENLKAQISQANIPSQKSQASHIERQGDYLQVILEEQDNLLAQRVIVAIGRSGNFRELEAQGNDHDKVFNRLHDPKEFNDKDVLIVGGGDSALESAISIAEQGGRTTLSYRKPAFTRPKSDNIEKLQSLVKAKKIKLQLNSHVEKIDASSVSLKSIDGSEHILPNDAVLSMLGREAPLDFFRRSKIAIAGESTARGWLFFALFFAFAIALYDWKNFGFLNALWNLSSFPDNAPSLVASWGGNWQALVDDRSSLLGTLVVSMKSRSFYYTLLYTSCIGFFGWQRIKRRKTPYVKAQTLSLFLVQLIPLFLLPELILPLLGYSGAFDSGIGKTIADNLFPSYISAEALAAQQWPEWGHPRAYWHAYGFILAWPLNVYNVFTPTPMTGWLIISAIQTFVIIPLLVYKFGKGAYCGWICSCGALAETLGDTQRHKMPHGPAWNKLNMLGQVILLAALILLVIRITGWIYPDSWMHQSFDFLLKGENKDYKLVNAFSWKWTVDVLLGGILGVGLYFKYSGRVWCRFACPLAALMNIYGRFSRFRIFSNKSKCISCNVCTSVCHQGIDVMSFANKGEPMQDPQCVRCSACVQSCPTGVLSFGEINKNTGDSLRTDKLIASPIQWVEMSDIRRP